MIPFINFTPIFWMYCGPYLPKVPRPVPQWIYSGVIWDSFLKF